MQSVNPAIVLYNTMLRERSLRATPCSKNISRVPLLDGRLRVQNRQCDAMAPSRGTQAASNCRHVHPAGWRVGAKSNW